MRKDERTEVRDQISSQRTAETLNRELKEITPKINELYQTMERWDLIFTNSAAYKGMRAGLTDMKRFLKEEEKQRQNLPDHVPDQPLTYDKMKTLKTRTDRYCAQKEQELAAKGSLSRRGMARRNMAIALSETIGDPERFSVPGLEASGGALCDLRERLDMKPSATRDEIARRFGGAMYLVGKNVNQLGVSGMQEVSKRISQHLALLTGQNGEELAEFAREGEEELGNLVSTAGVQEVEKKLSCCRSLLQEARTRGDGMDHPTLEQLCKIGERSAQIWREEAASRPPVRLPDGRTAPRTR